MVSGRSLLLLLATVVAALGLLSGDEVGLIVSGLTAMLMLTGWLFHASFRRAAIRSNQLSPVTIERLTRGGLIVILGGMMSVSVVGICLASSLGMGFAVPMVLAAGISLCSIGWVLWEYRPLVRQRKPPSPEDFNPYRSTESE